MAQKVLKTSLDYKIESAGNITVASTPGGTITIDTGSAGTTYVTGNLNVQGTTTTVNSTVVDIADNIIILNSGETGSGVSLNISGIEIDRGVLPDAQIVWNEGLLKFVMYKEKSPANTLGGLLVSSVQVTSGNTINNFDNDTTLAGNSSTSVPTQYAVKTYVDTAISGSTNTIYQNNSSVTVHDTGTNSYVETIIDGATLSRLNSSGFTIDTLSSYTTNGNLTITADGTGEVAISKVVNMPYQGSTPASAVSTNKFYAATPSSGGTGLFFVNPTYSDELVSKTKAIVYGIIF